VAVLHPGLILVAVHCAAGFRVAEPTPASNHATHALGWPRRILTRAGGISSPGSAWTAWSRPSTAALIVFSDPVRLVELVGATHLLSVAYYMRLIHGAKARNDKIDALEIARLLRGGNFPLSSVSPKRQSEKRREPRMNTDETRIKKRRQKGALRHTILCLHPCSIRVHPWLPSLLPG
jgi:hypothetical protein